MRRQNRFGVLPWVLPTKVGPLAGLIWLMYLVQRKEELVYLQALHR